jgi:hypothetical protein
MSKLKVLFFLCAVVAFTAGCRTRPPLNRAALSGITEGSSTRPEVEKLLGKPDDVLSGANQKTLTMYQDYDVKQKFHFLKDEYELSFLTAYFLFEPEGMLEKKFISDTQTTTTTQWGIRTVGTPITSDKLGKIIPGLTSYDQLRESFGPPMSEALTINGTITREWAFSRETMISRPKFQIIQASFDELDHLVDYVIKDELPEEKKIKPH